MIDPRSFLAVPLDFKGICHIYPPLVKDIVSDEQFFTYKDILTKEYDDIMDMYEKNGGDAKDAPSPLEYLLTLAYNAQYEQIVRKALYFFTHEQVHFLFDVKMILIGELDQELDVSSVDKLRLINMENYSDFQNSIRIACGAQEVKPFEEIPNEHPRAREMRRKAYYRDTIKRKKGNVQSNGESLSFSATIASICCMGLGLNPLNIGEISYSALGTLIRYYQEKRKYETDISSLLAGADSKKVKPKDWIRNIDD